MAEVKFQRIENWATKGPIVEVKFEIINLNDNMPNTFKKRLLFDTGNSNGIVIAESYIEEYQLDRNALSSVDVVSPGNEGSDSCVCFVNILEINIGKNNILKKPIYNIPLIFLNNSNSTPIIGQDVFQNFKCCVDYKNELFSIEEVKN